jgi:hypothetical protein
LDFESKTSSGNVCGVYEKRLIDCRQGEFGTLLREQHLAGARANNAVFRESGQTERAKKVSALGIGFKPRQCDMEQGVIREGNQGVSHPFFGYIWIREKGIVYPLDNFGVARREDRSISAGTEKPPYEACVRTWIWRRVL